MTFFQEEKTCENDAEISKFWNYKKKPNKTNRKWNISNCKQTKKIEKSKKQTQSQSQKRKFLLEKH